MREILTCCFPDVPYLRIVPTTEVCTLTGNQTHAPLLSRTTLLPTQPLRQRSSTSCYISFILLTLGSCWYPFCSFSRQYIRLVTRDFSFLDVSLPVMMTLLSYYHFLCNPKLWYDLPSRRNVMNTKNNKQNRNRNMYTRNSLTASWGKGVWKWWRGGEGIRQRTCLSDPWNGTTVWGWTVGWWVGLEEGRVNGKIGTSVVKYRRIKTISHLIVAIFKIIYFKSKFWYDIFPFSFVFIYMLTSPFISS